MKPKVVKIIGIHPVEVSDREFDQAVEHMWGDELDAAELERAQQHTREHFDRLRLIEIEVTPADAPVDWSAITQPVTGEPRSNWQALYDEQLVDPACGRWVFFLHECDPAQPLLTQTGELLLPKVTLVPSHLSHIEYDLP